MADVSWVKRGKYRALVHSAVDSSELLDAIFQLPSLLKGENVQILQAGRHVTYRLPLPVSNGRSIDAVVKRFGRQSFFKDFWDRCFGSKARRSYAASDYLHGAKVGTIPPVACVECWRGFRLRESYFVSLYLADTVCFKDELVDLWRRGAGYREFHDLMELVAGGIRALHDAGCLHNDLGNQNIQLTRSAPDGPFTGVAFLDHNRASLGIIPTHLDRARDLARLVWPSGFFPEFFRLYWHGEPPADFLSAYHRYWLRFRFHTRTRRFRHPIREIRYKIHPEMAPAQADYPELRDQWVWDDERGRPAPTLSEYDFRKMVGADALRRGRRVARAIKAGACSRPSSAIRDSSSVLDRVWAEVPDESMVPGLASNLKKNGILRVLVPIYGAESKGKTAMRLKASRRLAEEGLGVSFLVCQTRGSIRDAACWKRFTSYVLQETDAYADWISFGEGANTHRWGMVDAGDFETLFTAPLIPGEHAKRLAPAVVSPVADTAIGLYRSFLHKTRKSYAGQLLVFTEEVASDEETVRREISSLRFVSSLPVYILVMGALSPAALNVLRSIDGVAEVVRRF